MPLTDTECRNAKCPPGKARLRITDGLGLYLEVLPAGGRYWRLKYRHQGKEKRLGLGVYPAVTLAKARKERDNARALLETGQDPSEARKESKAAQVAASETTFEAVARSWHEQWKSARTDHHTAYVLSRMPLWRSFELILLLGLPRSRPRAGGGWAWPLPSREEVGDGWCQTRPKRCASFPAHRIEDPPTSPPRLGRGRSWGERGGLHWR